MAYSLATLKVLPEDEIRKFAEEDILAAIAPLPEESLRRYLTSDQAHSEDEIDSDEEDEEIDLEILKEEPDFISRVFNSLVALAVLASVVVLLVLLSLFCCLCSAGRACMRKLWRKVFWNSILRSLIQTSLEVFIGFF